MTKRKYELYWYESSKREKEEVCHWSSIGMNLASRSDTALTSGDLLSYLFLQPSKSPLNPIFLRLFELHIKFWNLLKTSNCPPQFAICNFKIQIYPLKSRSEHTFDSLCLFSTNYLCVMKRVEETGLWIFRLAYGGPRAYGFGIFGDDPLPIWLQGTVRSVWASPLWYIWAQHNSSRHINTTQYI